MSDTETGTDDADADEFLENLEDDLDIEDDASLGWATVRELFRSSENGTSGEATQGAAMQLLEEFDLVTIEENDDIWRYDPEAGIFTDDGVVRLRKRLADGLNFTYTRSRVTDILHRVRSETYVKRDSLEAPENMICVANGVLDLGELVELTTQEKQAPADAVRNLTLHPHSPEYRFTWSMNAPYDPDAPDIEATAFGRFLSGSVRPEDIPKLQEYAGDALRHWKQPRNLCAIVGPTDAGKGVFLRVLTAAFGDDNVASESLYSLSATRWGAAQLQYRPLNIANELSTGALKHPEMIKNLSGDGDSLSVENKGEDPFTLLPTSNHLFATNQVPQVQGADDAFYNRWLFVTFPETVPLEEQEDDLAERMTEDDDELAGILKWLLEGYARYHARTGNKFTGERSIAEKEDMWSAYGDSLDRFAATCITIDDATTDDALAKKDVYAVYKTMCDDVGVSVESQRKLTRELKKKEGVDDGKVTMDAHFDDATRPRVYTGIQLTDDGEEYLTEALGEQQPADDAQSGLGDTSGWGEPGPDDPDPEPEPEPEPESETGTQNIAQDQAVKSLLKKVNEMTDEGRGDPVQIDDVVSAVAHKDDRARHMIDNLTTNGTLTEDPEGHIRLTE